MPPVPMLTDIVVTPELLCRGSIAAVHKATQHSVPVAAKSFNLALASHPADHVARLLSNAVGDIIELCHPNLVQIIGIYQAQFNQPTIISELMGLGSLRERVMATDAAPFSFRDTIDISLGVLRGLRFLHEQQHPIIHARLTDHNVLLGADACVKVSDYGLSSFVHTCFAEHNQVGDIVAFLPPEVVCRGHAPSVKADVFAAGVILLECTVSAPPARGESLDHQTAARRRTADLHRVQQSEISTSGLPSTIRQCFEIQPTRRPASSQLEADLQSLCASTEYMWSASRVLLPVDGSGASVYSAAPSNIPLLGVDPRQQDGIDSEWQEFETLPPPVPVKHGRSELHGLQVAGGLSIYNMPKVQPAEDTSPNARTAFDEAEAQINDSLSSILVEEDHYSVPSPANAVQSQQELGAEPQGYSASASTGEAASADYSAIGDSASSTPTFRPTNPFAAEASQAQAQRQAAPSDSLEYADDAGDDDFSFETNDFYQSSADVQDSMPRPHGSAATEERDFSSEKPGMDDQHDSRILHQTSLAVDMLSDGFEPDGHLLDSPSGSDKEEFAFVANTLYSSQESLTAEGSEGNSEAHGEDSSLDANQAAESKTSVVSQAASKRGVDSYSTVVSNRPADTSGAKTFAVAKNNENTGGSVHSPLPVRIHNHTRDNVGTVPANTPMSQASPKAKPSIKPRKSVRKTLAKKMAGVVGKRSALASDDATMSHDTFWDASSTTLEPNSPGPQRAVEATTVERPPSPLAELLDRSSARSPLAGSPTLQRMFEANKERREAGGPKENDYTEESPAQLQEVLDGLSPSPAAETTQDTSPATAINMQSPRNDLEDSWANDLPLGQPDRQTGGTPIYGYNHLAPIQEPAVAEPAPVSPLTGLGNPGNRSPVLLARETPGNRTNGQPTAADAVDFCPPIPVRQTNRGGVGHSGTLPLRHSTFSAGSSAPSNFQTLPPQSRHLRTEIMPPLTQEPSNVPLVPTRRATMSRTNLTARNSGFAAHTPAHRHSPPVATMRSDSVDGQVAGPSRTPRTTPGQFPGAHSAAGHIQGQGQNSWLTTDQFLAPGPGVGGQAQRERQGSLGPASTMRHPGHGPVSSDHTRLRSATLSTRSRQQHQANDLEMINSPLFHGKLSREQAETVLWNKGVGSFLVRDGSAHGGAYSISLRVADRCKHFRVATDDLGCYGVPGWPKGHATMKDLISYHMKHPLSADSDADLLLLPCRRDR